MPDAQSDVSKAASKILRHKAVDFGLNIRDDAYFRIADVLGCSWLEQLGAEEGDLLNAVQSDEKRRYELWADLHNELWIRCVQGHSIRSVSDEALLWPVSKTDANRPDVAVHGTFWKNMDSIRVQGLHRGRRNHVHLQPSRSCHLREGCNVVIYVDVNAALRKGLKFFWSRNWVLLTHGPVPPECFLRIEDVESGKDYVWQECLDQEYRWHCRWTKAKNIWPCPQPRPQSRSRSPKRPQPPEFPPPEHLLGAVQGEHQEHIR